HASITFQHRSEFAQSTSTCNAAGPYAPYPHMPRPPKPHVSITLQHRCAFAQSTSTCNAAGPYAPYPHMPRPPKPHVSITLQHRCAFAQSTSTGNAAGPYAPYPHMPRTPKPHVSIITALPILYHLPGAPSTGKLPNPRTGQRRPAGPFLLLSRFSWASREVTRLLLRAVRGSGGPYMYPFPCFVLLPSVPGVISGI